MDKPTYAFSTFVRHYDSAGFENNDDQFVMLELGPGDSISSGVIARCFGAKKSYLVDKGNDAIASSTSYIPLFEFLKERFPNIDACNGDLTIEELIEKWGIDYLTNGLVSLSELPDASVDYLWSQSVLEHIRKPDFSNYIKEFRRLMTNNGVSVHGVDLKDHLSYSHNNLRFSENVWESDFMSNSGFYTNRILFSEMMSIFGENGFDAKAINIKRWDDIPTPRKKLASDFDNVSDDDLLIAEFDVVLRPVL
jgi:Methyltransferase domain